MNEEPKSFWWKFWGRPVRFFLWLALISLAATIGSGVIANKVNRGPNGNDLAAQGIVFGLGAVFVVALIGLILSAIPRTRPAMAWVLRRWIFCGAAVITLVALFYAEEDWRGKRAWEQCKAELRAGGVELNWEKYIPPTVPDEQNVFKAPKMQEWFVLTNHDRSRTNELSARLSGSTAQNQITASVGASNKIVTEAAARDYLAWSDQFIPDFDLMRRALERPLVRMEGDYSQPAAMPIPAFIGLRGAARMLAQRTHCYLLLHQPEKALTELTLIHDLCRLGQAPPGGKPITLVAAMMNIAVTELYVNAAGEGFRLGAWQEPQLVVLQHQLKDIHLMLSLMESFETGRASICRLIETASAGKLLTSFDSTMIYPSIVPHCWIYRNLINVVEAYQISGRCFDPAHESISPSASKEELRRLQTFLNSNSPFKIATRTAVPNFFKATETAARQQTLANEALIACALERYHLAQGEYPELLTALTPQFIDRIPHDIINDGQLKYHRTNDAFVLYSVGWNETDDGGTKTLTKDGRPDFENGDWVWDFSKK